MKKRKMKNLKAEIMFYSILSVMFLIISIFVIKLYIDHINAETNKILENTELSYITKNITTLNNGLYKVDIKKDLLKMKNLNNIKTLTYKINNENFYFDISVIKLENDYNFIINKIIDDSHNVKAKMNLQNIKSIEYRTGNANDSTVLNLITEYNEEYFVMTENTYYFLGEDIESISYMDNHFFYVSYNPSYKSLENVSSCQDEKNNIKGFNNNHYYYKYGKINFLKDYYQKLASKTYTVKDKCEDLENKEEN